MKNITKTKTRKQANANFREILALQKKGVYEKKTNFPRFGNWILMIGDDRIQSQDIQKAVYEIVSVWIKWLECLDGDTPSDGRKLKERLSQILSECLNDGKSSDDDWYIKFVGNK